MPTRLPTSLSLGPPEKTACHEPQAHPLLCGISLFPKTAPELKDLRHDSHAGFSCVKQGLPLFNMCSSEAPSTLDPLGGLLIGGSDPKVCTTRGVEVQASCIYMPEHQAGQTKRCKQASKTDSCWISGDMAVCRTHVHSFWRNSLGL